MPDILAIVSKAIFEQEARRDGKVAGLGAVLPLDRYTSKNKALAPLAQGGRLVLVTVRPHNERLWLVAILEELAFAGDAWRARAPNRVPITDLSHLRKTIKLASGKGLSQDKGALGMSLQTPRALAAQDVEEILGTLAGPADLAASLPASVSPAVRALVEQLGKSPEDEALRERAARRLSAEGAAAVAQKLLAKWKRLNAHEEGGLPCLCKDCIALAPERTEVGGMTFGRDFVLKRGRLLSFWAPEEVLAGGPEVQHSVRTSLGLRIAALDKARKLRARERAKLRAR